MALSASRDINLVSAENTSLLEGKNDSHGGTVGVGIGVGSGGWGISVSASANKGKGSESGNGTTHSETTVDAGNNLILNSGRDTTLTGAQVSGDKVVMDVGRNLTLTSEQDSDRYDSKQQNASAGGSFTFGSMSGSASVNLSNKAGYTAIGYSRAGEVRQLLLAQLLQAGLQAQRANLLVIQRLGAQVLAAVPFGHVAQMQVGRPGEELGQSRCQCVERLLRRVPGGHAFTLGRDGRQRFARRCGYQ